VEIAKIPAGRAPPAEINVVVEIPQGSLVKYEFDRESGVLFVDRFLETAMVYPGNYGFVPQTLGEDSNPLDVLVVAPVAVLPGAVVRCRPVAALLMEDEHGADDKIIAVPLAGAAQPGLPASMREQIAHFFGHYKDLEPGTWTKVKGWGDAGEAARLILAAMARMRAAEQRGKA
jgi:inorganic pyrophosphatase